jgi:hypothetical protein
LARLRLIAESRRSGMSALGLTAFNLGAVIAGMLDRDRTPLIFPSQPDYRRNTDATPVKSRNVPLTAVRHGQRFQAFAAAASPW